MEKQTRFIMFFALFLSSCGVSPISPIPTSTVALVTREPPFLPTLTQTPPPTIPIQTILEPTETSTLEPTETPTLLNTVIPIPPDITEVSEGFLSYTGADSIFFTTSETVQIEDLRLFYMTELVNAGWTWVYTDIGISQVPESETNLLILEFKKDGDKLGILAYGPEEGGAITFAAVGYSGYYQFIYLLGGMGAGDVKLLGAVGGFLGPQGVFGAFIFIGIVGGFYALILLVIHRILKGTTNRYWMMLRSLLQTGRLIHIPSSPMESKPKLMYGLAIAIGTFLSLGLRNHF